MDLLNLKNKIYLFFSSAVCFLLSYKFVSAALLDPKTKTDIGEQTTKLNSTAGFDASASLPVIIQYVIQGFLSLLAIIFIILMLYAGYNWMTATGDEEKVKKAKDTIQRAVIGLVIIVAAYGITYFVFRALSGTTGGPG